ncbi:MAG: DNA-3-methyladenine glycosylase 2 family protein [Candidatus Sumerlaeia bacterium]|nr:DNA-3-methyladenine glycosylase 2 family protein [Candidatus Sumerlaeia bacterium]
MGVEKNNGACRQPPALPASPRKALDHLRASDPALDAAIDRVGPFALEAHEPTLHAFCVEIIGQQLSVTAASAIARRFSDRFGRGDSFDPDAVVAAPVEELRALGLSNAKARTVPGLCQFWREHRLTPERARRMSDAELLALLTQVKGIGPWTVKMFLIFALRRPDVLPEEDLGLRAGLQLMRGLPEPPAQKAVPAMTAHWAPWRTVGTWYAWGLLRVHRQDKLAARTSEPLDA